MKIFARLISLNSINSGFSSETTDSLSKNVRRKLKKRWRSEKKERRRQLKPGKGTKPRVDFNINKFNAAF